MVAEVKAGRTERNPKKASRTRDSDKDEQINVFFCLGGNITKIRRTHTHTGTRTSSVRVFLSLSSVGVEGLWLEPASSGRGDESEHTRVGVRCTLC